MEFQYGETLITSGLNSDPLQHVSVTGASPSNYISPPSERRSATGIGFGQYATPVTAASSEWKDWLPEAHSNPKSAYQSSRVGDGNDICEVRCQNSPLPNQMKSDEAGPIHQTDGDKTGDRLVHIPPNGRENATYRERLVDIRPPRIVKRRMAFNAIRRRNMSAKLVSRDAPGSSTTVCMTCYGANPSKLQLDATPDKLIPRLKPGSTVRCFMDFRSFRRGGLADADIKHAKAALKRVIEELNSLDFRLKFEYVRQKDQRDFTLAYDAPDEIRPDPNFFAYAFFPDARQNERKIKMTSIAFKDEYRQSIFNILCHEFAHTLGMRHWNAAAKEAFRPSVQHPPNSDNKRSVMGPYTHPSELHFHPEDAEWLRDFYARAEGEVLYGYTIVDVAIN